MQVQRIQHNNYNQTFGAKINIIGTNFGSSTMQQLSKKAEKIGTSEDVVEFIFSNFRTKGSVANFKILKILIFLLIVALIFGIGMRLFLELNKSNIVESTTIEDKYYNSLDELKAGTTININIQCNLGGNATYVIKSDQSIELRDESTVCSIKRTNTNSHKCQ